MMRIADLNSIWGIIGIEEYLIHVKELGYMQIVHLISKISYMYFQKELHVMQFNFMNNRALVFTPESLTLKSRFHKCLDPRFFLTPAKLNNPARCLEEGDVFRVNAVSWYEQRNHILTLDTLTKRTQISLFVRIPVETSLLIISTFFTLYENKIFNEIFYMIVLTMVQKISRRSAC